MHSDREDVGVNPSANPTFRTVLEAGMSRRHVLRGGLGAAALAALGVPFQPRADAASAPFAFKGVPPRRPIR